MKEILLVLCTFLIVCVHGAVVWDPITTDGTFSQVATLMFKQGNWSNPLNWGGVLPTTNDDVLIENPIVSIFENVSQVRCRSITLRNGNLSLGHLSLEGAGNFLYVENGVILVGLDQCNNISLMRSSFEGPLNTPPTTLSIHNSTLISPSTCALITIIKVTQQLPLSACYCWEEYVL